ncbi:LamG-like jellyroll fold domain-containing protein [uncultured Polaribacter sp.]|uniref:LamG-like jellyroll fold domain-containing protein n=1 Tax=uncultured Polaribacter sp. TaxID=174711 RepID=UPI00259BA649|nr:LamG-like jellyroll fold domain-containing protein [uncultured Polaribacter sp.]
MKKIILILVVLFLSYNTISQNNITDGLLLHYKFNNNVKDSSLNNHDGNDNEIIYVKDRKGNDNSSAYFNGINSFIDLPNLSELKPELPLSVALWIKFDNLSNEESVSFTTDFAEDNHTGVWSSLSGGKIAISYGDNTGNTTSVNRRSKVGSSQLMANLWYHFVFVIKDKHDMEIYINGVNDQGHYSGYSNYGLRYSKNSGSLGRKDSNTNLSPYFFKGMLDDFMYWNRALTEKDVKSLYNLQTLSKVSLSLQKDNNISIFPNPVRNKFQIETSKVIHHLNLYDMNGKKYRLDYQMNQKEFDVKKLSKGIYILNLITSSGIVNKRLIIE